MIFGTNDSRWDSLNNTVVRNIMGHNGSGTNTHMTAKYDSPNHNCICINID